ncbi:hypothetical protein FRB91_000838 [Serendipita sp. 411]|nr:hypothetical protein FRB91_000838 [Serendipita sp. 411]
MVEIAGSSSSSSQSEKSSASFVCGINLTGLEFAVGVSSEDMKSKSNSSQVSSTSDFGPPSLVTTPVKPDVAAAIEECQTELEALGGGLGTALAPPVFPKSISTSQSSSASPSGSGDFGSVGSSKGEASHSASTADSLISVDSSNVEDSITIVERVIVGCFEGGGVADGKERPLRRADCRSRAIQG